jgi:RNA polymerase sigma factor (sigma-70 family)
VNATIARLTRIPSAPAAGDGLLLDAFLAGDQAAFACLVRRHAALVYATCRRVLHHTQDAEDAFQATFLVLARRAADVWPREALGSWLFGVAHRVALKARAVRSRRTARERPLEEVPCSHPDAPDSDLAQAVHRVVAKLPEVYRAAVVACDLQGLSRKEAAERLGWSEGTLSGRLARARELLAQRFQRLGLALPAGGLAAFALTESVSAAVVQSTIALATGTAGAGASAPVMALTEGMVRSMALFKLKTLTAVLFVVCALGLGAFAATAPGASPGAGPGDAPTQKLAPGSPPAPVAAKPAEPLPKARADNPPRKLATDRDRLQGSWRIVALTEGGKTTPTDSKDPMVIEISGSTLRMPFREGGASTTGSTTTGSGTGTTGGSTTGGTTGASGSGGAGNSSTSSSTSATDAVWKHREYTFTLDETSTPRRIDLFSTKKSGVHGIYEFTLPSAQCATCHHHPFGDTGPQLLRDLAGCAPVLKDPRLVRDLGVRLALTIDGTRPEKFDGSGVIVFELKRVPDLDRAVEESVERAELVLRKRQVEDLLRAAQRAQEKARYEAELKAVTAQLEELLLRDAQRRALLQLREAQARVEVARAHADAAQAEVQRAAAVLRKAQVNVAAAEKALSELMKPQPQPQPEQVFTVHVRPLTEAEKVVRVKATGKQTVLEGLAYATDVVPIKSTEVSVWVVRDKEVLPVDVPAITRGADTKTNYVLKPGDQLFVQIKPGK